MIYNDDNSICNGWHRKWSESRICAKGMQSLCRDLGWQYKIQVHSDATAAIGIARRRGLGKIRHLDVEDLWVQAKVRDKTIELVKVLGAENPADMLTKYVDKGILNKMMAKLGMNILPGRSSAAPELPPDNSPSRAD